MTYQFNKVELKNEDGQIHVVLHIDSSNTRFEFGSDFNFDKDESLEKSAKGFVKKHFSKIKVASIVIVTGTVILTTIPMQKARAHEVNFNMSYLFYGKTSSLVSQVDRTKGNLNLVSPSYFDINAMGSLEISKLYDDNFVTEMHNRGIKVVPFLSNHWDRELGRAALQNREQLSTEIANFVIEKKLDGVQVDIENTTEIDRNDYTDLVRLLRQKLPQGKEVSVAVAANPGGWSKGWHGTYDYNKLAQYADYLMIMAYDQSYEGSEAGPVASYPWVEKSIKYALNQGVPGGKIVLGVPFYGRLWKTDGTFAGLAVSNSRVDGLLRNYRGTVTFDEQSKSPRATITILESDPKPTIASKTLTAGTYHIWYENDASLEAKFDLLHKYELKGTGSWSLGQEDPTIWQSYSSWLDHDSSIYHTHKVESGDTLWKIATANNMTVNELMNLNNLTDYEIQVGQVLKIKKLNNPFKDIGFLNQQAQYEILYLVDKKVIYGTSATTFSPSAPITRGQVVMMLGRMLINSGITTIPENWTTNTYFKDVPTNSKDLELLKYAAVVSQTGVFVGNPDGTLDPSSPISRENMAIVLDRATKAISGQSLVDIAGGKAGKVTDLNVARKDTREAINSLSALGITVNEQFNPKGDVKRTHFASFLTRTMKYMLPNK
ncbi:glycosyl hydrolase family 18 protein [Ureibacillus manganicus]|uniref:glycosyl hydrolase family 18 protein n=1 Tax=Ureibacillus manganicus TaxID=1266064 RepID=UPI00068ABB21|nr:glycosyl hydrolase family 18 protein [Ureibacillus manganicus]